MKPLLPAVLCALLSATPAAAQHDGHQGHAMPADEDNADEGNEVVVDPRTGPTMAREGSGTSWRPDSSQDPRGGGALHAMQGDWMFMGHILLNGVYDRQQGPRGGEAGFASGMIMGMARGELGIGRRIDLRVMLSPDPLMGRRGYPLHLAAGETADGATPLIDRQHPHDFFMELSARYTHVLTGDISAFVYAGLPGEPAFGPPAFMHRMSIMDSPEAPISHHWLDSTHISFGVVTFGLDFGDFKIEGSRFNGREPDERRWNIETGQLDSTALRLSWNPTYNLALQASWAHLVSPEQLEPDENSVRWSASALYTRRWDDGHWWSATLAWGRRDGDDAFVLESAAGRGLWTIFGRAEIAENDELTFAGGHHGPRYTVGKVSLGAIRDVELGRGIRLGLGALYAMNFVPAPLEALYAGDPDGAMAFIRLKID
jgi:hypothetical protein